VKQRGGVAVVQDPDDALCGDMPRSALENVEVDYCLPANRIPKVLEKLSHERVELQSPIPSLLEQETEIALDRNPVSESPPGRPSEFACPSCGGVLNEVHDGKVLRFRCRVGHAYGVASLTADQQDKIEAALWAALRALEVQIALNGRLARRAQERGHRHTAEMFKQSEQTARDQANTIRAALTRSERGVPEDVPARDPA
jgi:two-component system, chemotaxis family, protein-glutamate methylesterase/glutaminase